MIGRSLDSHGLTPAQRVAKIRKEVSGVYAQYGITSWEREFLDSVAARSTLTTKQESVLSKIEGKVSGELER